MNEQKPLTKTQKMITVCALAIILAGFIGTYAYFLTGAGTNEEEKLTVKTGTMALTFDDNDQGFSKVMSFGESATKEFKITNSGNLDATTNLLWYNLTNTYLAQSLSYKLEYKTTSSGKWSPVETYYSNVPRSLSPDTYNLATNLSIPAEKEYYYKLTITFENLDINQNSDERATLNTKFLIGDAIAETNNVLVAKEFWNSTELIWEYSEVIKEVIFEKAINPPTGYTLTYNLTDPSSDGTVTAYLVPSSSIEIEFWDEEEKEWKIEERTAYIAHIQADGKIKANQNSSGLFSNFTNLENINGLENFDTGNVTDMSYMFFRCKSLTTLDVNNFDTSNVTNMSSMFSNCPSLTTLDLSSFNTNNVTDMSYMFNDCQNITTLDLSGFDTSNVTNMGYMFWNCIGLKMLDVSKFATSNVTGKINMFYNINSSVKITVSNDTMKQWVIDTSDSPKLTSDNFTA